MALKDLDELRKIKFPRSIIPREGQFKESILMVLEMVCEKQAAHFLTFDGKRRQGGGIQTGNGQDPGHAKSENNYPKNRASG